MWLAVAMVPEFNDYDDDDVVVVAATVATVISIGFLSVSLSSFISFPFSSRHQNTFSFRIIIVR